MCWDQRFRAWVNADMWCLSRIAAPAFLLLSALAPLQGQIVRDGTYPCSITRIAVSPSGDVVVSAGSGYDPELRAWNLFSKKLLWQSRAPITQDIDFLSFDPRGTMVVSAGGKGGLNVWDAATGRLVRTVFEGNQITAAAFSKDGTLIALSRDVGLTQLCTLESWSCADYLSGANVPTSLAFSPDGRYIAGGERDEVRLWDATTGNLTRTVPARPGTPPRFFVDDAERQAQLWRDVWQVAFSSDATKLAAGTDGFVQVWDVSSGREISFCKSGGRVGKLIFSHDSKQLVWANWNHEVRAWRIGPRESRVLSKETSGDLETSPDYASLLLPDGKKTITILSLSSGDLLGRIKCTM